MGAKDVIDYLSMKKLLMLTAIVCSLILSPVANAEWTKVGVSKSGKIHYVDLQRIEKPLRE